jgi:hypothetical protein
MRVYIGVLLSQRLFQKKRIERGGVGVGLIFSKAPHFPHLNQSHTLSPGAVSRQATFAVCRLTIVIEHGPSLVPVIDRVSTRAFSAAPSSVLMVDTHTLDLRRRAPPILSATAPRDHAVIVWASVPYMATDRAASSPSTRDLGDHAPVVTALKTGEKLNYTENRGIEPSESSILSSAHTSLGSGPTISVGRTTRVNGCVTVVSGSPRVLAVSPHKGHQLDQHPNNGVR